MVKKKVGSKGVPRKGAKKGPKSPWFGGIEGAKLKKGSWGFIPINTRGWATLAILIILNVFAALYLDLNVLEIDRWVRFGVVFLLSLLVFILIAKNKTQGVRDDI